MKLPHRMESISSGCAIKSSWFTINEKRKKARREGRGGGKDGTSYRYVLVASAFSPRKLRWISTGFMIIFVKPRRWKPRSVDALSIRTAANDISVFVAVRVFLSLFSLSPLFYDGAAASHASRTDSERDKLRCRV